MLSQVSLCHQLREFFYWMCSSPNSNDRELQRADIRADPVDYSPASYRKAAYQQYILMTHGILAKEFDELFRPVLSWLYVGGTHLPLELTWGSESTRFTRLMQNLIIITSSLYMSHNLTS